VNLLAAPVADRAVEGRAVTQGSGAYTSRGPGGFYLKAPIGLSATISSSARHPRQKDALKTVALGPNSAAGETSGRSYFSSFGRSSVGYNYLTTLEFLLRRFRRD
jgi:hypothetical protein